MRRPGWVGHLLALPGLVLFLLIIAVSHRLDDCVYAGVPLSVDLVGEGIGSTRTERFPRVASVCEWQMERGGTYEVVAEIPSLTVALYVSIGLVVVGTVLTLVHILWLGRDAEPVRRSWPWASSVPRA